jgi:glyoxylase-like metal-dependent hydrolase (beta-lactamase superfamily II)
MSTVTEICSAVACQFQKTVLNRLMLQHYENGHYTWHIFDPQVKTDLWSSIIVSKRNVLLIDPTEIEVAEIQKLGRPLGILVTSGTHERAAHEMSEKLEIPVASSVEAGTSFDLPPHILLNPFSLFYDCLVIPLPGGGPGECAFFHNESKTMIIGDALIHLESTGFAILPEKYCQNLRELKKSLKKLLKYDFQHFMFAHGSPILHDAKEKLKDLL